MGPTLRKVALTAHVVVSVGWLGAAAAFLALALVTATSDDELLVQGVFRAMEPLTNLAIVPLAIASLLTGVIQAVGTPWGLFRHYWVVVKLILTVFATLVLVDFMATVSSAAAEVADPTLARADLRALSGPPILHAGGGIVVLLIITSLSMFKPSGLTRHGQRKRREAGQRRAAAESRQG